MMDKWADCLVSAVRTNPDQIHIDFVECHSDFGCVICENLILSRADLISKMKKGQPALQFPGLPWANGAKDKMYIW